MSQKEKKARFFCEYCDTEVPDHATICPKCGRFFASVRCPNCGFTGDHQMFSNGCPNCGYAMKGEKPSQENTKNSKRKAKRFPSRKGIDKTNYHKKRTDEALPYWIYIIAIFLLGLLLYTIIQYL